MTLQGRCHLSQAPYDTFISPAGGVWTEEPSECNGHLETDLWQLLAHLADAHEVAVEGCQSLRLPGQVVCAVHVRRLCGKGAVHQASHNHLQSAPQPLCTGLLSRSISAPSQPLLSIGCHRKPCLGTLCHASLKRKGRQNKRNS